MNAWRILHDKVHYWKGHFVPTEILGKLEEELTARAAAAPHQEGRPSGPQFEVAEPGPDDGFFLDVPGAYMIGRRHREVVLDGFRVVVPSQDWSSILADVKLAPERRFSDGTSYYKLHGLAWCLVLTAPLRELLVAGMEAQLADADREGDEDDKEFARRVNALNSKYGEKVLLSKRAEAINAASDENKKSN